MNDLPAEWIEPAEEELGPHGQPVPPPTWTPEREAEVAKWRDELMAAGEARDRARIKAFGSMMASLRNKVSTPSSFSQSLGIDVVEAKYWRDMARFLYPAIEKRRKEILEPKKAKVRSAEMQRKIDQRDVDIVRMAGEGKTASEMAAVLNIDRKTVIAAIRRMKGTSECTSPSATKSASATTPNTNATTSLVVHPQPTE